MEFVAKEKAKIKDVLTKSQESEEQFSKAIQAKLRRSMEISKENREVQILALQGKLRDHVSCVSWILSFGVVVFV